MKVINQTNRFGIKQKQQEQIIIKTKNDKNSQQINSINLVEQCKYNQTQTNNKELYIKKFKSLETNEIPPELIEEITHKQINFSEQQMTKTKQKLQSLMQMIPNKKDIVVKKDQNKFNSLKQFLLGINKNQSQIQSNTPSFSINNLTTDTISSAHPKKQDVKSPVSFTYKRMINSKSAIKDKQLIQVNSDIPSLQRFISNQVIFDLKSLQEHRILMQKLQHQKVDLQAPYVYYIQPRILAKDENTKIYGQMNQNDDWLNIMQQKLNNRLLQVQLNQTDSEYD